MKAVFDALNIVYDEKEKRSVCASEPAIARVYFCDNRLSHRGHRRDCRSTDRADLCRPRQRTEWLVWLGVGRSSRNGGCRPSVLYRYGPSRDKAQWAWVTAGSLVAAVLWLVASLLFSWYVSSFGSYNETYGSLGAVIGFMTWIWISAIVVLLGAEINAETEHQTARDTTEGPRKPMGVRGATMADNVGRSTGAPA